MCPRRRRALSAAPEVWFGSKEWTPLVAQFASSSVAFALALIGLAAEAQVPSPNQNRRQDVAASSCEPDLIRLRGLDLLQGSIRSQGDSLGVPDSHVEVKWASNPSARDSLSSHSAHSLVTRTDHAGSYEFCGVPLNILVTIEAHADGFGAARRSVLFSPNQRRVDLTLDPTKDSVRASQRPIPLSGVTTTAARGAIPEFEERRAAHRGHFITREELAKNEAKRLADILSQLPGARVVRGNGGHAWLTGNRGQISMIRTPRPDRSDAQLGARSACYSDVYLDGVLVYSSGGAQPLFDLGSLSPAGIEAIEYYAGGAQTPPQLNKTGSACGVLVIWTRR